MGICVTLSFRMKHSLFSLFIFVILMASCVAPNNRISTATVIPSAQPTETVMPSTPTPEPTATPAPISPVPLKHGINMGNMLEAPNEGESGVTIQEEYFDLINHAKSQFNDSRAGLRFDATRQSRAKANSTASARFIPRPRSVRDEMFSEVNRECTVASNFSRSVRSGGSRSVWIVSR